MTTIKISPFSVIIQTAFWSTRIKACEKLHNAFGTRMNTNLNHTSFTCITRLQKREIRTSSILNYVLILNLPFYGARILQRRGFSLNYPFWLSLETEENEKEATQLRNDSPTFPRQPTKQIRFKNQQHTMTPDHNFKRTKSQPVPQIYESKQSII